MIRKTGSELRIRHTAETGGIRHLGNRVKGSSAHSLCPYGSIRFNHKPERAGKTLAALRLPGLLESSLGRTLLGHWSGFANDSCIFEGERNADNSRSNQGLPTFTLRKPVDQVVRRYRLQLRSGFRCEGCFSRLLERNAPPGSRRARRAGRWNFEVCVQDDRGPVPVQS